VLGLVVCFELGLRLETAGTGSLVIGSKQPVLCTVLGLFHIGASTRRGCTPFTLTRDQHCSRFVVVSNHQIQMVPFASYR